MDEANPNPTRGAPFGASGRAWSLAAVVGFSWLCSGRPSPEPSDLLGGGSAHPPRDHHTAEAVGAPALSSVGASAPAGASVSVADPGGQTGDSFGQRASVFCAVRGVCCVEGFDRRPYVSLRYKSASVLGVADSCFVRGSGKSRRLKEFVFRQATPEFDSGPIVVRLGVT